MAPSPRLAATSGFCAKMGSSLVTASFCVEAKGGFLDLGAACGSQDISEVLEVGYDAGPMGSGPIHVWRSRESHGIKAALSPRLRSNLRWRKAGLRKAIRCSDLKALELTAKARFAIARPRYIAILHCIKGNILSKILSLRGGLSAALHQAFYRLRSAQIGGDIRTILATTCVFLHVKNGFSDW